MGAEVGGSTIFVTVAEPLGGWRAVGAEVGFLTPPLADTRDDADRGLSAAILGGVNVPDGFIKVTESAGFTRSARLHVSGGAVKALAAEAAAGINSGCRGTYALKSIVAFIS